MSEKSLISGDSKLALDLVNVLGLPSHTHAFELRVAVGEVAQVKCWYYPEIGPDAVEVLAEYTLEPKVPPAEKAD